MAIHSRRPASRILRRLWNYGGRLTRWAIGISVIWPFALFLVALLPDGRGIVPILALLPVAAGIYFLLVRINPLLVALPTALFQEARVLSRWMLAIVGLDLAIGIYLSIVPINADVGLASVLVLTGLAFLFLLAVPSRFGIIRWALMLIIIGLTVIFFLGGRAAVQKRIADQAPPPAAAQPRAEEFTCQAGEEVLTVLVGPETSHRIWANNEWEARDGATGEWHSIPAGWSSGSGQAPEGLLRVRCLANGTILRFQKVR